MQKQSCQKLCFFRIHAKGYFIPVGRDALIPLPGLAVYSIICYAPRHKPKNIHAGAAERMLWQYRIILSADTASEVRQMLSQKRR